MYFYLPFYAIINKYSRILLLVSIRLVLFLAQLITDTDTKLLLVRNEEDMNIFKSSLESAITELRRALA